MATSLQPPLPIEFPFVKVDQRVTPFPASSYIVNPKIIRYLLEKVEKTTEIQIRGKNKIMSKFGIANTNIKLETFYFFL